MSFSRILEIIHNKEIGLKLVTEDAIIVVEIET